MAIRQLSAFLENKPGALVAVTEALSRAGVDMRALSVADTQDFGILRLIAAALGREEEFTEGHTEDDWAKLFFETSDIFKDGDITWEEFNRKGYYIVPCPEDRKPTPAMRWFYEKREALTNLVKLLAGEEINIEYLYAFLSPAKGRAFVALRVADAEKAESILSAAGFETGSEGAF